MRQIRIRRSSRFGVEPEELATFSAWSKATSALENEFQFIAKAGNQFFGEGTHWVEEREVVSNTFPDLDVWKRITKSMDAWVRGDIETHTNFFAQEAIVIAPTGETARGRFEIGQTFAAEHRALPNKVMKIVTCDMIYPASEVAVVAMTGSILHDHISIPQNWYSTQTWVRRFGYWLITAHQIFHLR